MPVVRIHSVAAIAFLFFIPILASADWPEFRGPTGQGHAEASGLPLEWSSSKNVAWKQAIPGKGWSSPVIVKGRIYLTTAETTSGSKEPSLRALCLDAVSGKVLWNTEVLRGQPASVHSKNSHASPTPIFDGERLYVHYGHDGTAAVSQDGTVLWKQTELRYEPRHGNGGSPISVDDLLVFSMDGTDHQFLVALDRSSGKIRWKTDRRSEAIKRFSFSTPLLITHGGRRQIVSPASDFVAAYNPADGAELWRVRYEGYSVIPRPVYAHGLVFVVTGYESSSVLAIKPDGVGDVTDTHVAWRLRRNAPHTPSLLCVGNELFMVSDAGVASCFDARSGLVHWQQRLGGNYSASLIQADGKVYFLSEEGVGTVIKAAKQFEQLAVNKLGERTLASYAVADGALFIRSETHLYRIQSR
jgi:outer membrane protein assembly factor BamB